MTVLTESQREYLSIRRLGRFATIERDGAPHVVPTGWIYDPEADRFEMLGDEIEKTRRFRNVLKNSAVALVIDDIASTDPWWPRGLMIQGRGVALERQGDADARLFVIPERAVSWGLRRAGLPPPEPGS